MHTLKVQLGLTLSALLFISMFLFGFVLLILWQRSEVQQETLAAQKFLQMASASALFAAETTAGEDTLPPEVQALFDEHNFRCLQWQRQREPDFNSHGSCPPAPSLGPLLKEAAQGREKTSYSGMVWNGLSFSRQFLLLAMPVHHEGDSGGVIGLVHSLENAATPIREAEKIFFAYLVINVLIFTTIGFTRLVHLVIRPIQRLARLADSRTDKSDSDFFHGERWGEFGQLSLSLNRLVARIDGDKQELQSTVQSLKAANEALQKNRDEMIRAEKLASIGRLSAGLAHEIGNPLGIIQGYIDLLGDDDLTPKDRKAFSRRAVHELSRINTLIRSLLDLSRTPTTSAVAPVELHGLLHDIVAAVRVRKTSRKMTYSSDFQATDSTVTVDCDGLRQVFLNCLFNAIDAIEEKTGEEGGEIRLTTDNFISENGEASIRITIHDSGMGLAEEHRGAIFDPFFTTKEVGKGTGLGLAVAHNMVKKSGGSINFSSTFGQGSRISITLPLTRQANSPSQQEEVL